MKIKEFLRLEFQEKTLVKGDKVKVVSLNSKYYTGYVIKTGDKVTSLVMNRKTK